MKAVGLIFLLRSGIIIKDQIKIIYFSFWACIYSKLSMENELDRSAMPREKVILPYIYKESWDGWRTQMALRNVQGQPQREWGQLSLGTTGSMGRAHATRLTQSRTWWEMASRVATDILTEVREGTQGASLSTAAPTQQGHKHCADTLIPR